MHTSFEYKVVEVCELNKSLEVQVSNLIIENYKYHKDVMYFKFLFCEKENKLEEIIAELERTQNSIKIMNFGTKQLKHILKLENFSEDHYDLGYKK